MLGLLGTMPLGAHLLSREVTRPPPVPPAPPSADGLTPEPERPPAERVRRAREDVEAPPQPKGSPKGIDVSHHQNKIDWGRVRKEGYEFAFIKCSEGRTYRDPRYKENWDAAGEAKFARGAYHFYRSTSTPEAQLRNIAGCFQGDRIGELPPVLDVETDGQSFDGLSCDTVLQDIRQILEGMHKLTGQVPILYTNVYTWRDALCGSDTLDAYPLWLALYSSKIRLPPGWTRWAFWQKTSTGSIPGVTGDVDLDIFNGDTEAMLLLGKRRIK